MNELFYSIGRLAEAATLLIGLATITTLLITGIIVITCFTLRDSLKDRALNLANTLTTQYIERRNTNKNTLTQQIQKQDTRIKQAKSLRKRIGLKEEEKCKTQSSSESSKTQQEPPTDNSPNKATQSEATKE